MAYTPETLSEVFQTIGGTFRAFFYRTDDAIAIVLGASYFTNVDDFGIRAGDMIEVFSTAEANHFSLGVTAVSANGTATVIMSGISEIAQLALAEKVDTTATIVTLKALTVADLSNGDKIYMRGGLAADDGAQGNVIYLSGSSATTDDIVVFQPNVGTGRYIREDWYRKNEIYGAWWRFVYGDAAAQVANGVKMEDLFDFIMASSEGGKCFFPQGDLYLEMTAAYTFTKIRGWSFYCVSDSGLAGTGTRFFLRGGGMTQFYKYRTVIGFHWYDCYTLVWGSGMDGHIDIGAAPYWDAADTDQNGTPAPDAAALSSFLCTWNRCTFADNVAAGFDSDMAQVFLHSAVGLRFNDCWMVGANVSVKLGEEGALHADADGRMLAKGACGQTTFNNCLIYGDIQYVRFSEITVIGGQFDKPSGVSAPTRAAMLSQHADADVADGFAFYGVGLAADGDRSDVLVRSDFLQGLVIDGACTVGKYSYVAEADGSADLWDVSPSLHSVAGTEPATGILRILSSCTGLNLESRTPYSTLLNFVVKDERLSLLNTRRVIRKNHLRDGEMRLYFGSLNFAPATNDISAEAWRHILNGSGATRAASRQTWTVGSEPDSSSPYYLRYAKSVAGTGATADDLVQRIPGVATLAGKYVLLSFIALGDSSYTLTPYYTQNFGTGGSPSTAVTAFMTAQSITTTKTRFMALVALPSITGKTLGSDGNDHLVIGFRFPLNATHQIDIGDVKLEEGFIPSPMEPRTEQDVFSEQIPYSEKLGGNTGDRVFADGRANSTTHGFFTLNYGRKRATAVTPPTVTFVGTAATDFEIERAGSAVIAPSAAIVATSGRIGTTACQVDVTVASGLTAGEGITFKAKTTSGYILIRAEL